VPADPFVCAAECAARDSIRAPGSVAFSTLELVPRFDLRSAPARASARSIFSARYLRVPFFAAAIAGSVLRFGGSFSAARYRFVLCVWIVPCSLICGLLFLMRFAAVLDASD
jgi:hypothetical protein